MPQSRREDDEQESNGEDLSGRVSSCASRWWSGRRGRWGAYEGKSDDCFEACHVGLAGVKRAGGNLVVWCLDGLQLLWRWSSARRTLMAVAGRRFGGAAVVDRQAKSGELWPLAATESR